MNKKAPGWHMPVGGSFYIYFGLSYSFPKHMSRNCMMELSG